MALSYDESNALMQDANFRGRVKVACLKFADYITNEGPSVTAHNTRFKWAQRTYQNPDQSAFEATPGTVMDPNVQSQGAAIDDATLQTAVETTLNKLM